MYLYIVICYVIITSGDIDDDCQIGQQQKKTLNNNNSVTCYHLVKVNFCFILNLQIMLQRVQTQVIVKSLNEFKYTRI